MKKVFGLMTIALLAVFWVAPALAQEQPPPTAQHPAPDPGTPQPKPQPRAPRLPHDPLENLMFPPELIMQHQRELGLTDQQKTYMRGEIGKTSAIFNDLQWQLHDAMEALHETMKANIVNEQLAVSQLNKVLDFEGQIKRLHMELAIKIKNNLSPEQQQKLHGMRHTRSPSPQGMGHGPGRPGIRVVGPGPARGSPTANSPTKFLIPTHWFKPARESRPGRFSRALL